MSRWGFEPILDSYGMIAILVGSLLVLLLAIRPWQSRNRNRRRQLTLLSLRATVILLVLLAMLRPSFVSTQSRPQSATLVMLVDQSRSMQVEDLAGGRSRWQGVQQTFEEIESTLNDVAEIIEVRTYAFAEQLEPLEIEAGEVILPERPEGEQTDLARAVRDAMQRETGKRLVGVVLVSDGAQRVYQPRFDVQQAVRELKRMSAPLFTIAMGKPRDQSQARDVGIEKLRDQYTVFVNNQFDVQGAVRIQGYLNLGIPLKITIEGPHSETPTTLGPVELRAKEDNQVVDFRLPFTPTVPGAYRLHVDVESQEGELVTSNNRMTAYLNVLDGGLRILYLEGNLFSQEALTLRQSLAESVDIDLDYRPIDPRLRAQWPIDLTRELETIAYDIILIGDVDAEALGEENLNRFATMVTEQGRGLMMLGGINTLGPGGYRNTPLDPVLPIELGQFNRQRFGADQPIRSDVHLEGPLQMIPTPGRPHFVTHLAAGPENEIAWRKLKPLLGANRIDDLRPNAIRLAETAAGDALLVGREFAPGRVLVFAGDSTYRWWRYGNEETHKRFWRQAMLWLANQDELLRRDVWVQLQRRRFRPGESVRFQTGARAENGDVLEDAQFTATLARNDAPTEPIQLAPDASDWAGTIESIGASGDYTIRVEASVDGETIGSAEAKFQVESIDLELTDPAANPQQLGMLAALTKELGGRSLPAEQLNELLQQIRDQPPEMKMEVESKWRLGDSTADSLPFLVLFVALLGTEWFLRKRWGLA